MFIYRIPCGPIQTNSYLLEKTPENLCWVIDPAEGEPIISLMQQHQLTLSGILLTHGHFDHILGIKDLLDFQPNCPIYINPFDKDCLFNAEMNGSTNFFNAFSLDLSTTILPYSQELNLGGEIYQIIETPGHTPGSITLMNKDSLFTGDFLFKETIGRTDFQRSSPRDMQESLRKMILLLKNQKEEITVYPGHYETTTWLSELQSNPFLVRIAKNVGQ
jgi:hydroxyacylglutathione hydrolase